MMTKTLRDRALDEIRSRGMNVYKFTQSLGKKASTAEKWLYGIVTNPRMDTVEAVFAKLGLEVNA